MKHDYGCPYHYGPIDYGPPGGDDYGEDCRCEVCVAPEIIIETKTFKAIVHPTRRMRFRAWRFRRRLRKMGMTELERDVSRRLDEAVMYGERRKR